MNGLQRSLRSVVLVAIFSFAFIAPASVSAQMPDPKQMSGQPLPVGDLPVGTVTARVIRGQLSNPLEGQSVELTGAGAPTATKTSKTDGSGRATFTGLTPGSVVQVAVTVDGERVESRQFEVPNVGGIRVMLVTTDTAAAKGKDQSPLPPQAPVAGSVTFGGESRFVIEAGDDALNVFSILQIVNTSGGPVQAEPLVFDIPSDGIGLGLLQGSTPAAVAAGHRVTVSGPFPPGVTPVQFAYSIPLGSDSITIEQKLPAALPQLSVVVQKIGPAVQVVSSQIAEHREMAAEGQTYVVGQGGPLKAGDTVSLTLTGLPARPSWPRMTAVLLAVAIVAGGAWLATRKPALAIPPSRRNLQGRREKLFAELASLEAERRKGTIDPDAYAARRESLVTALEDLYRGLDREVA